MYSGVTTKVELDAFTRLAAASNMTIDANEQIKSDMKIARDFQETYNCDDPQYREILGYIKEEYDAKPPDTIISGTVGAYLFSCIQPSATVNPVCIPDCASGFHDCDVPSCDLPSYHKSNGELLKINDISNEDANVFIARGDSLTSADRAALRNDGIKVITLYNQDGNSINYIHGESINLDSPEPQPQPQPQPSTSSGWAWLWLIIGILAIIVIIGIIMASVR